MKALYRKYRPLRLEDVIGQPQVIEPLTNSLKQGKVNHAYIFTGPRGTGKTSVARILAHEINNFEYQLEDDYVDIIEIDGASNRGIENIRELREKVAIAPTSGKYKVYIIDEVHMLTKDAFNALLKTLEEPPEHAVFIMATTDAYKVPITITSRAQTFTFKLSSPEAMLSHLKMITEKEQFNITEDALKLVVKRGGGSYRDTLSLLDQVSTLSDTEITKELVVNALGLPEDEKVAQLLNAYRSRDITEVTKQLKELLNTGIKPETLGEELIGQILDNPEPDLFLLLSKLPDVKAPFAEAKLLVALAGEIPSSLTPAARVAAPARHAQPSATATRSPVGRGTEQLSTMSAISSPGAAPTVSPPSITPDMSSPSASTDNSQPAQPTSNTVFDWQDFLLNVQRLNDAIYSQLKNAAYDVEGDSLTIFPDKNIARTILSRDNNKKILVQAANGFAIKIGEVGGQASSGKNDDLLSKISGIMGGEVKNDGGESPF